MSLAEIIYKKATCEKNCGDEVSFLHHHYLCNVVAKAVREATWTFLEPVDLSKECVCLLHSSEQCMLKHASNGMEAAYRGFACL